MSPLAWYIVYNNKILDLEEGGRDMAYFLAHMDFANILVDIGSKNLDSFLWCDEFLANCSEPQREGGDLSSVTHIVTHLVITDPITISSPLDITIHTQTGNTVRDNNFVSRCLNMVRCALSRSLTSITKTMTLWCSQQTRCNISWGNNLIRYAWMFICSWLHRSADQACLVPHSISAGMNYKLVTDSWDWVKLWEFLSVCHVSRVIRDMRACVCAK